MVVLGISIGTRISGIAILNNGELVVWQSHTFPETWSAAKLEKIITRYEKYIRTHKVAMVVVKIPRLTHHNSAITSLLSKLASLVKFHGCLLDYTTRKEVKAKLPALTTSFDIQTHTLAQSPQLLSEYTAEQTNKKPYHHKMFEAVLIAHLWKDRE
jgi:hypothetical protein